MSRRISGIAPLAAFLSLVLAAPASADTTLGSLAIPGGSPHAEHCSGYVAAELSSATGVDFTVPGGGGAINQWQIDTTGANPGDSVTFVVVRPTSNNMYTLVGFDTKNLPNPLPADHIATFPISTPIIVRGGETLGMTASPTVTCFWDQSASIPGPDAAVGMTASFPLTPGETMTPQVNGSPAVMNVAANLVMAQDAGVSASAVPSTVSVGTPALLASTVSNAGPSSSPFTVASGIPAGLTVDSVAAGSGACTTSGQLVTCTITGLAPGQSVPMDIVVTPTVARSYSYTVSAVVSGLWPDPNPANNSASTSLTAVPVALQASQCYVPNLKSVRARLAKRMLGLLGCKVGKIKRVHSKGVSKGSVIKTTPGAGTYGAGKVVNLQVSSGPARHKHH